MADSSNNLKIYLDGDESDGARPLQFVQQVLSPDVPPSTVYTFAASKRIHDGEESQTFRGVFTSSRLDGTFKVERLDTVCKLVSGDRRVDNLKKEAKLYATTLAKLQDNVVPIFHGLFRESTLQAGEDPSKSARMCIVLQYCGKSVTVDRYSEEEIRLQIAHKMLALHRAGVRHGDYHRRHVLQMPVAPYGLRIIDFDRADEHECAMPVDLEIGLHTWEPIAAEFNCHELFEVIVNRLSLYIPCFTTYCGRTISLRDYYLETPDEWVAWGREHAFEKKDIEDSVLRKEAEDIIRTFHMLYPKAPRGSDSEDAKQAGDGGNST